MFPNDVDCDWSEVRRRLSEKLKGGRDRQKFWWFWGSPFGHGRRHFGGFGQAGAHQADDLADFDLNDLENGGEDTMGGRHHGRGSEGWSFGWVFDLLRGFGRTDRPLEQGDLRWLTLDLIAAQPRHGYEIIKAITDELHGHYTPSPGAIYPVLTLLEETGLIASEAKGSKKLYHLTEEGRAEVEAHQADIRAAKARLARAAARFGDNPAPELVRAMNNLRAALQVRLSRGGLTAEAIHAITAALDRAAAEIERG
jgi:DNA-binding PadR family transcriptional regulator